MLKVFKSNKTSEMFSPQCEGRGGEDRKKKLETKEPFQDSESLLPAKTAIANLTNFFRHFKITTDH